MKHRKKPIVIEATQWFRNGDHPKDGSDSSIEGKFVRYFRHPKISGDAVCAHCNKRFHYHGWIDTFNARTIDLIICPGDWVLIDVVGQVFTIQPENFNILYERIAKAE